MLFDALAAAAQMGGPSHLVAKPRPPKGRRCNARHVYWTTRGAWALRIVEGRARITGTFATETLAVRCAMKAWAEPASFFYPPVSAWAEQYAEYKATHAPGTVKAGPRAKIKAKMTSGPAIKRVGAKAKMKARSTKASGRAMSQAGSLAASPSPVLCVMSAAGMQLFDCSFC